jgi:outer membrane protein assembly factor BamB
MKKLAQSKYFKVMSLFLICLFIFNIDVFAQRRKLEKERRERQKREKVKKNVAAKLDNLPSAFVFEWQFASRNTTKLPALATNDTVYLPLDDGRVVALEAQNGQLRWETQPGGKITSPLIANDEQIFISSRLETESGSEGALRVINKRSGLTDWTKKLNRSFSNPLSLIDQTIYGASEDNNFYSLNSKSGDINWSIPLGSIAKGKPLITDEEIFIGTESGVLYSLANNNGEEFWQFQAQGALRASATVEDNRVFIADSSGYIYSLDRDTGKLIWKIRTGAAIESTPQVFGKTLVVTSFDNFVYGFSTKNGDTFWKARLNGRLSFDPIVSSDQLLITPQSSDQLFLLSSKGKPLGQFRIDNTNSIVAPPTLEESGLFLVTDEGLVAARATK